MALYVISWQNWSLSMYSEENVGEFGSDSILNYITIEQKKKPRICKLVRVLMILKTLGLYPIVLLIFAIIRILKTSSILQDPGFEIWQDNK